MCGVYFPSARVSVSSHEYLWFLHSLEDAGLVSLMTSSPRTVSAVLPVCLEGH